MLKKELAVIKSKILVAIAVNFLLKIFVIFFFISGGTLIFLRFLGMTYFYEEVMFFLFLLLVCFFTSLIFAYRKLPGDKKILSYLDLVSSTPSLLMSFCDDIELGAWKNKITVNKIPVVTTCDKRRVVSFFVALFFLLVCFFVPAQQVVKKNKLNITYDQQEIKEDIELLAEEKILEDEEVDNLYKQLEEISKTADEDNPVKTWEALDYLKNKINDKALVFEQKMIKAMNNAELTKQTLEQLNKAMSEKKMRENSAAIKDQMSAIGKMLQNILKKNPGMFNSLKNVMKNLQSGDNGNLDNNDLEKLANAALMSKKQLQKMLQRMRQRNCKNGKCNNSSSLRKKSKAGNGKSKEKSLQELLDFIDDNLKKSKKLKRLCKSGLKSMASSCAGVDRGPGHRALTFEDRKLKHNGVYVEKNVTGTPESTKGSETLESMYTAPQVDPQKQASSGALNKTRSSRLINNNMHVYPKHKKSISKFFKK